MRKLLAGAAVVAASVFTGPARAEGEWVGKEAPEIQVSSWIQSDGRTSLADYRGEVVLLEFWSTH